MYMYILIYIYTLCKYICVYMYQLYVYYQYFNIPLPSRLGLKNTLTEHCKGVRPFL